MCKTEIASNMHYRAVRFMVETRKMHLEVVIEIDIPVDIVQDEFRMKAVEDGLGRSISKGLYDQGVSFQIRKISSKIR